MGISDSSSRTGVLMARLSAHDLRLPVPAARSAAFRYFLDRISLKLPVIGAILEKATIARWTRTLATMFAAGVPLVESLDAVAGASGNASTSPARARSRRRSAPARA
jgi:type IV pilus assembly protein PilC